MTAILICLTAQCVAVALLVIQARNTHKWLLMLRKRVDEQTLTINGHSAELMRLRAAVKGKQ